MNQIATPPRPQSQTSPRGAEPACAVALERFVYDDAIVRKFLVAMYAWGIVAFAVGLFVALLLVFPKLTFGLSFLTFGRLRPLHTNAAIFAFAGNAIFAAIYYSTQRLCKARMYSDTLSKLHFWGWQLVIVTAALTLPLGFTSSKEYAELEWPIDLLITGVWVTFGWNMIGTILRRRERHLYVSIWFYLATFLTVALLHVVNSLELPVSFLKSYSMYAGVQDALVQWWYGHNAVAFFLTTPFLGLMYYFVPKAANRPVFSYRLSIVHFWSLIFLYIWAGPHHLLYTALPDWAQSLGTVFSIMLIAPSWGGMVNGLLTLRGAWDRVREDPVLKFMVVGITAYGMATFEGPMLSLKSVNALTHYTDYIIGHVHVGALAWNGGLSFATLYYVIPRMYRTKLYSLRLANLHFWLATLGILFYAIPMYVAGITQSLMWQEFTADGALRYPNFLETVVRLKPMYMMRAGGGSLFMLGAVVAVYNLYRTARQGSFLADEQAFAPAAAKPTADHRDGWHRRLESRPVQFAVLTIVSVAVGGVVEFVPTALIRSNIPTIAAVKPYTPLEIEGRDLYIREGCVGCHSQMIRPFRAETARYGDYSKAGEFVYDHPFLWGSKRTGPDLQREGGKYPDAWHFVHMRQPSATSPRSIMPAYGWLYDAALDTSHIEGKIITLRRLGVPYPDGYERRAEAELKAQADVIATGLTRGGQAVTADKEIIALIAYLQRLGRDVSTPPAAAPAVAAVVSGGR